MGQRSDLSRRGRDRSIFEIRYIAF